LRADCVYVAELVEGRLPTARTVAVYRDGGPADGFEQDLPGSAASHVLTDGLFAWSNGVRRLFPADPVLQELAANGYVGIRLNDSAGQVIGLIALTGKSPLKHVSVAKSVMGAFAARAAVELKRKRAEDNLRES
jgi:hypothetical protein